MKSYKIAREMLECKALSDGARLVVTSCDCFRFYCSWRASEKGQPEKSRSTYVHASHLGQDGLFAGSGTRAAQHSVIVPPLAQSAAVFPSIQHHQTSNFNSQPAPTQLTDAIPGLLHLNIDNAPKNGEMSRRWCQND